jgi:hypothetical protein
MSNEQQPATIVVFRKWKEDGTILALFPDDIADYAGHCSSYAHIGQHSAADYAACIAASVPATPREYAALKRELESPPYHYRLIVRKRYQRRR